MDKLSAFWWRIKPTYNDDTVDRLNYIYTNYIILAFAITVSLKQYVGVPLQCWVPAQFKGGWEQYVENYCFVENTFWVPMDEDIPTNISVREEKELTYYQWVPFVLAIQATMFFMPHLLWGALNGHRGLSLTPVINSAMQTKKGDGRGPPKVLKPEEDAKKQTKQAGDRIHEVMKYNKVAKDVAKGEKRALVEMVNYLKGLGIHTTVMYLFCKCLYILNVVVQFYLMNQFLGEQHYTWWGAGILNDLMKGRSWKQSGRFPRVSYCDIEIRHFAQNRRWTIQCVLMINMINEKIYLVLWFWFLVVGIVTILNTAYWLYVSIHRDNKLKFIRMFLNAQGVKFEETDLIDFVYSHMKLDGLTVIRLLCESAGDMKAGEVVNQLYERYHSEKEGSQQSKHAQYDKPDRIALQLARCYEHGEGNQ